MYIRWYRSYDYGWFVYTHSHRFHSVYSTHFYMCFPKPHYSLDPRPFWLLDCVRKDLGNNFAQNCLAGMPNLQTQIFNAIGQVLSIFTSCHQWNFNSGRLMCPHWQHSSAQDASGQSYSPDSFLHGHTPGVRECKLPSRA